MKRSSVSELYKGYLVVSLLLVYMYDLL